MLGFQHETETDALAQLTEGATRYSLVVSGEGCFLCLSLCSRYA